MITPERCAHHQHVRHRRREPAHFRIPAREALVEVVLRRDRRFAAPLVVLAERVLWCVDVDVDEANEAPVGARLQRQQVLRRRADALFQSVREVLLEERRKLSVLSPQLPAQV